MRFLSRLQFKLIICLLGLLPLLVKAETSKDDLATEHLNTANAYFKQLDQSQQDSLTHLISKIRNSDDSLNLVSSNETSQKNAIYLLVQGLEFFDFDLWEPFDILQKSGHNSYFLHWSKQDSFKSNQNKFREALSTLIRNFPQNEIVVFGFSAGGVIALTVWDELMNQLSPDTFSRLSLRNIVAVSHGYGATRMARIASPFVGRTTISIGIGIDGKLSHPLIERCEQWITTDGNRDIHARINADGRSPQVLQNAACGEDKLHKLPHDGHFSALSSVLRSSIDEDNLKTN